MQWKQPAWFCPAVSQSSEHTVVLCFFFFLSLATGCDRVVLHAAQTAVKVAKH